MKYRIYVDRIKLIDSYLISKKEYIKELQSLRNLYSTLLLWNGRNERSIRYEWATHTFLYNLGIKREKTKDVDLNFKQKWYKKIGYTILGIVSLIFIK